MKTSNPLAGPHPNATTTHCEEPDSAQPLVTVLMPVYNAGAFLPCSLNSILRQTYRNFELLILDNCSTDDSPCILETYRRRDVRIRVLRNESNLGLPASLNRGLHEATGKYIARMDADDLARSKRLALQVACLESNPDIDICGGQIVKHVGTRKYWVRYPVSHEEIHVTLLFHSCFPHPAVMLRREALLRGGFIYDPQSPAEDYELWTRMVGPSKACNLPQVLLDYRCHPQQISGTDYHRVSQQRNLIRSRVVQHLIPDARPEDLALHHMISIPHDVFDTEMLARAESWLLRLIKANQSAHLYAEPAMRRVFAQRWVRICAQAAHQGMSVFRLFRKSPLSDASILSHGAAKLLAKCAMRQI